MVCCGADVDPSDRPTGVVESVLCDNECREAIRQRELKQKIKSDRKKHEEMVAAAMQAHEAKKLSAAKAGGDGGGDVGGDGSGEEANAFDTLDHEDVVPQLLPEVEAAVVQARVEGEVYKRQQAQAEAQRREQKEKTTAGVTQKKVTEQVTSFIENPDAKKQDPNRCAQPRCKEKVGLLGEVCKYCRKKYCLTHRHPEGHGDECAAARKKQSQTEFKQHANRVQKSGSAKAAAGSVADRSSLQAKLKSKVNAASTSRKKPAGKKKK
eukprot:GFYU01061632.1.p1 GENE.GFYU01061632.1~~GFYU01061632.1.p1  ORF type:complete len:266 (-),score=95.57 GFYU01061632.1:22-819(-)